MAMLFIATIFFIIALAVHRKQAFEFCWQPTRHTWVAVGTGLLAFGLSASMLLFDGPSSLGASIIHYGLIYVGCGFAIPWGYTLLVERNSVASMGLTRERWLLSLILNVGVAALFSPLIIFEIDLSAINWLQFGKAAFTLTGAGGLFELFLYYGFIHLRLKKAFGPIPAIVGTSALYMLWHVGTQLPYEPDPVAALGKLFLVGIMYQSLFSITYNLLTIWPFFLCVGVMIDVAINIGAIEPISQQLPYAVATVVLIIVTGVVLAWIVRPQSKLNRQIQQAKTTIGEEIV